MLKNTGFMAASTLVRLLSSLVLFIALARLFGPEDFGRLFYNFTLASVFLLPLEYGFGPQMLREIGRAPSDLPHIMGRIFVAKLLLSVVVVVLVLLYFALLPARRGDALFFSLLLAASMLGSFADFFLVAFRGVGKFHEETKVALFSSLVHFVLICALAMAGASLMLIGVGFVASRLVGLLWSWYSYRRILGAMAWRGLGLGSALATLRDSFAYAVDLGFTSFFQQVDTLIVNHYLGPAGVGIYQAGMRFLQGAMQFAPVLGNVFLPALANKLDQPDELKRLSAKLNLQMLGMGVAGWIGFGVLGGTLSSLVYGNRYADLVPLWPYIGLLMLLRYVAASQGVLLTASGAQKVRVWAQMTALALLAGSAPLLIGRYGLAGMLMSLSLAAAALLVIYGAALWRRRVPSGFNTVTLGMTCGVLGVALFLLRI
ncbi:Membrane protein involved in the export of O-antigen and teichoic acid [Duganella sacchari]|uniref:Membrane protein involved in the export of O-antigen and teichoic acid n=1 Tax=Duganella sacchari TaxID=551987 RepID=A0A1M7R0U1_9BURK|nr:oligosaccharide flippase family protein [Duganella sacchari]SHN38054.1 Membrane protein involved in the export of O-antigen and teichoic acid [Duganella sacchari]